MARDLPRQCSLKWGEPKKCYRTLEEAEAAVNGGPGLNAYHCQHCGNYHVGHKPGVKFGSRFPDSKRQQKRRLRQELRRLRRG